MNTVGGATLSRGIRRFALHTNAYGVHDLTVAELDSDVPSSFAVPLPVARAEPANGASVTGFGYGCTASGSAAPGFKTRINTTWNAATHAASTSVSCPGDSGGPIVNAAGQVVAIHSAGSGSPPDTVGLAYADRVWISQMNAIYGNRQLCTECTRVGFRTWNGSNWLQAANGGGAGVNATGLALGSWETFRLVFIAPNGTAVTPWVGLQAENGQWMVAENGGGGVVNANRDLLGGWETFRWTVDATLLNWTFKTITTDQYLCAENGGGGVVVANRGPLASTWETFALTVL